MKSHLKKKNQKNLQAYGYMVSQILVKHIGLDNFMGDLIIIIKINYI